MYPIRNLVVKNGKSKKIQKLRIALCAVMKNIECEEKKRKIQKQIALLPIQENIIYPTFIICHATLSYFSHTFSLTNSSPVSPPENLSWTQTSEEFTYMCMTSHLAFHDSYMSHHSCFDLQVALPLADLEGLLVKSLGKCVCTWSAKSSSMMEEQFVWYKFILLITTRINQFVSVFNVNVFLYQAFM